MVARNQLYEKGLLRDIGQVFSYQAFFFFTLNFHLNSLCIREFVAQVCSAGAQLGRWVGSQEAVMHLWPLHCTNQLSTCRSPICMCDWGIWGANAFRRESDLYEKLVLFGFRLVFPFFLISFMDSYSWKWIFEPSTKKWKSIMWLLLQTLEWASCVMKSTPTASLFSSFLSHTHPHTHPHAVLMRLCSRCTVVMYDCGGQS